MIGNILLILTIFIFICIFSYEFKYWNTGLLKKSEGSQLSKIGYSIATATITTIKIVAIIGGISFVISVII